MASGAGGGGGGGKIRTRRCHQGPTKPYPRGRQQQQQQGILSRVTESVKNIVPAWLQKYFIKNETAYVHSDDNRESRHWQENTQNDHLLYTDEENPIINDGRITPDQTVSNAEEPSTSRSALNYPDVLTRPSLHRSHLNFSMLESPTLHCQPSTSSAFPIGSSGFSFVKEIKDSTSQHDDDNISTTSGFSSRASDKDIAVSKNTSGPPLWSPEAERPHSLSQHTATSSKKPAFNLSAFGTLSPSLGNSSILKTSQLGDSPFYPGKTTYGGAAAAARQSKIRSTPYQAPVRRQMKAKQVNSQSYGVTSSTARRILQSLEKMSSPLADAKRIPSAVSSPLSSPLDRSGLDITDIQAKRKKVEPHYPPVQRLMTPKPISIATNRSVYFKPSLTPSAEARTTNQRIDKKHNIGHEKNLSPGQKVEQHESDFSYPNFSTPATNGLSSGVGGGGKMRRERARFVSKLPDEEEEVEAPILPKISLPITTTSLPVFSFCSSLSTSSCLSPISATQPLSNKVQIASPNNAGSPVFRFSSPIVKSTEADILPPTSIGFTFSVPVVKSSEISASGSISESTISSSVKDSTTINSTSNNKEEDEDYEGPFRPAKTLKEGSVLDILKSPGFTSPKTGSPAAVQPATTSIEVYTRPAISTFSSSGPGFGETFKAGTTWQCDTCLVQNKGIDNKCVACQAAKVPPKDTAKQTGTMTLSNSVRPTLPTAGTFGFGDKFKPAVGTWDCDTCLVQNKPEATKCVACETPKPGTGVKQTLTLPVASENAVTVTPSSSSYSIATDTLGFGDKFKKPKDSWECLVCCVLNKGEDSKCVACMSEKPGGGSVPVPCSNTTSVSMPSGGFLGLDKFKKPEGSWDCEVCLVQNKADNTKCVACESAKPGTKSELIGFGTLSSSSDSGAPSFKFGISASTSESSQTGASTGSFKFGEQAGFKSDSASPNPMSGGFKFSKPVGDFKFGVSSSDCNSEESKKDSKNDSNFNFGVPSGLSSSSPSVSFQFGSPNPGPQEKKEELTTSTTAGFTFGTNVTTSLTPAATTVTMTPSENKTGVGGFSFGSTETKNTAVTPFAFKKPEENKEETPAAKGGGFRFGNVESACLPSASVFVMGRTEEKQQEPVTSATSLVFGKKADSEEPKSQQVFSFGNSEQTKDESTAKRAFSFNLTKPVENQTEQSTKVPFPFGTQTSTAADQGATKTVFNFLSSNSSNSNVTPPTTSAAGGMFGGVTSASNPPVTAFIFGQASNTGTTSAFGNPTESSASPSFVFSQDSKPATTSSTGVAVGPFVFGTGASSSNTATSSFSFGATTSTGSAGSSSFAFGAGSSTPSASPAFGTSQTPAFGQNQGANQPTAPGFGSLSSSLFSTGSQPPAPAFGSVSSSSQPPVFGQPPTQQSGFGSGTTPNSSPVFHFGSSTANFNFTNNNPSGVFTFGANAGTPATSAQPSGSAGFPFNPSPAAFTVGTNGKNMFSASGTSVSGRKIKTAIRRRK
ncbi:nuclear pore complex protein Nup153 [Notamacropus eugenii]|uniref:nuclear pore complex protein Nup153 n=1 Tax=Notamacropus eugenii TaxID=9315 RepID=UPI003B66D6AC